jgi:hypothetical protein
MSPAFEDEQPINPFDFWKGANFKLKIRKVDGYWNYDKSEFEPINPIADNDDKIKEIWGKQYPLTPFLAASNFKSYDELKEKLNRVITGTRNTNTIESADLPPATNSAVKSNGKTTQSASEDDDDTLSYFSKLAADE